jgi:hypothetical protein
LTGSGDDQSFKRNLERNMLMKNGNISRRQLLQGSAVLGCLAAAPRSIAASEFGSADQPRPSAVTNPLKPPAEGAIPVAFLVSDGAVVIDFAGPWEVFQDVMIPGRMDMPFQLYTVSESTKPIQASGGMKIVPDYTLEKRRCHHVRLHRRVSSGEDRLAGRQIRNHPSRLLCRLFAEISGYPDEARR